MIVGTIAPNSGVESDPFRIVFIGVGDLGWILMGGHLIPPLTVLNATYIQSATGGTGAGKIHFGILRLSVVP
jgi:hypothetical protein